jgi:indole-3-glycerol phosphate synthase
MAPVDAYPGTEHLPNSKNIRTTPETQGKSGWTRPLGTLGDLVTSAERRAGVLISRRAELESKAASAGNQPSLEAALRRPNVALIAEIKRASPSRGAIMMGLDPANQACAYERGGAAAISVLTEPDRFGGSNDDLASAGRSSRLPILRKDFHVTDIQLHEARSIGASAALLIVRAVPPDRFERLVKTANEIGLEIVAEVRDLSELELALDAGCRIIGVNNRNLETLEIEPRTAETIIPQIPAECIAVAESGYSDLHSIRSVAAAGADAVLIGSFLSAADDPASLVRRLIDVKRVPRGG